MDLVLKKFSMTPRGGIYGDFHGDGLPVSYDDEVTPEQVAKIDKMLKPEFEKGEWQTVESETPQEQ